MRDWPRGGARVASVLAARLVPWAFMVGSGCGVAEPDARGCTEGVFRRCLGANACEGTKRCGDDAAWGPCVCSGEVGAGGEGAGGTDPGTAGFGGGPSTGGTGVAGGGFGAGGSLTTGGGGSGGDNFGGSGFAGMGAGGAGSAGAPGSGGAFPGAGGRAPFDAGSDPARNRVAAGNVCERLTTIQCAGEAYCCTSPGRDFESCKATLLSQCRDELFIDAISLDPITGFSPSQTEAAFSAFEQRSSQCDPGVALWATTVSGLRGILQGTRAAGANCTPAASELLQNVKVAGHLASCANPAGTACLPAGGFPAPPWICTARGGPGATCFSDVNCTDGNYCPNPRLDLPTSSGPRCLARKAAGQACTAANECLSLTCRGRICVTATTQTAFCLAPTP